MRTNQPLKTLAVLTLALCLWSCGSNPEHELQRARLALDNNRPEAALQLVQSVLEAKPDDIEALLVRADAQMRLLNFGASKNTLDKVLRLQADNTEAHRLYGSWVFARTFNLLRQSDLSTNDKLLKEYDETLAVGKDEVRWLEDQGNRQAEASYLRAKLALQDYARYQAIDTTERKNLSNLNPDGTPNEDPDSTLGKLKSTMNDLGKVARAQLEDALQLDPNLLDAALDYARLLRTDKDWKAAWALAQKMSQVKELNPTLAGDLVLMVMQVPEEIQPQSARKELGWKLSNLVPEAERKSPAWRIAAARLYLLDDDNDSTLAQLEPIYRGDTSDMNIPYLLAQAYVGKKNYPKARDIFEKMLTRNANSAELQMRYGQVLLQMGEDNLAREALRRATELEPDNTVARRLFLNLMVQSNTIDAVGKDVDRLLEEKPTDPSALQLKLQFEQARGQRSEVDQLMARMEKIDPLNADHLRVMVSGYTYLEQFDHVESCARKLIQISPDSLDAYLSLANALLAQNKDDEVEPLLRTAKEKFAKETSLDQMLARVYIMRRRYDRATEILDKIIEAEPRNIDARLLQAQTLAYMQLPREAAQQVESALEVDPNNVQAHALASNIYQVLGNTEKAAEHLSLIDSEKISERDAPALKAQLLIKRGDLDQAATVCNRAIAAGHSDPMLRRLLAGIYLKQGQPSQAEFQLLAMVRTNPDVAMNFVILTEFYIRQKMFDKGLEEFARLQLLNEPLARLSRASLLSTNKQPDRALAELEPILRPMILRADPSSLAIAEAMSRIYLGMGQPDKAIDTLMRLVDAGVKSPEAQLSIIDIRSARQPVDKTVEQLDSLHKLLNPEDSRVRFSILERYARLNRVDRMLSLLDQWIDIRPNSWRLWQIKGQTLRSAGRLDESAKVLGKAIEMSPENSALYVDLALTQQQAGQFPAAEATLDKCAKIDGGARIVALASKGQMFVDLGLFKKATEVYDELESAGRSADPRINLSMGQALYEMKRYDEAKRRLEEIADYSSNYPDAQVLMARIESTQGKTEEARSRMEALAKNEQFAAIASRELLKLDAKSNQTRDLMAWADRMLSVENLPDAEREAWLRTRVWIAAQGGNWDEVRDTLERLVEIKPDDPGLAAARISVILMQSKYEAARLALSRSAALQQAPLGKLLSVAIDGKVPADAKFNALDRFMSSLAVGDTDSANSAIEELPPFRTMFKDDLRQLMGRSDLTSPAMMNAFRNLIVATAALRAGLPNLCENICGALVLQSPGLTPAYSLLADSLMAQDRDIDQVKTLVLKNLPNTSVALYASANSLYRQGNYTDAIAKLKTLLEREPTNIHATYELTTYQQKAGQIDDAILGLEKIWNGKTVYRIPAGNDLAYLIAEHKPDRLTEAGVIARQCLDAQPQNSPLLDTVAWIEHKQGKDKEALAHIAQISKTLSSLPEIHFHQAEIYAALGNENWAKYHYEAAASGPDGVPEVMAARSKLTG